MTSAVCPACSQPSVHSFGRIPEVPVHSCRLMRDRNEARTFQRGTIDLALCPSCGFIFNTCFDASLLQYNAHYEETQAFSPRFRAFARDLATTWVDRYGLRGKTVLEIGCGKGEFLEYLVDAGISQGTGIDPGTHPERTSATHAGRISRIIDTFDDRYGRITADAVVCRHTLEHIAPVREFLLTLRQSLPADSNIPILFELPDFERVLHEEAFWDVYYEHCSYFTRTSLQRLFSACGFDVLDITHAYQDQYLLLEARPRLTHCASSPPSANVDIDEMAALADAYQAGVQHRVQRWTTRLQRMQAQKQKVVLWGAGSKAVAFLHAVGNAHTAVAAAVDINPYKHSKYLPGTGHPVLAPDELATLHPSLIIAMNDVYLGEIAEHLARLDLSCPLESL
ncbi:class I SAM-dependent methyltransferase [Streptomyces sp. NPDC058701]|uniref:class I SAM-dependent methyltransferase n=1 Tax=Streptomyces sp. NPDC058701 TaxID=3346608 RepID=UPI003646F7FC